MIKRYGISLEDRKLYHSILRDLITLDQKRETGQQKNILSYGGVSKGHFNLVPISRAEILGQIRQKEKYSKWIINLLCEICCGHYHNYPTIPLLKFLSYFALYETYQDTWR